MQSFCRAYKNEKVGSEQHYCKQDKGYGKVVGGVDGSSANMLLWNDGLASPLKGEGLRARLVVETCLAATMPEPVPSQECKIMQV